MQYHAEKKVSQIKLNNLEKVTQTNKLENKCNLKNFIQEDD